MAREAELDQQAMFARADRLMDEAEIARLYGDTETYVLKAKESATVAMEAMQLCRQ